MDSLVRERLPKDLRQAARIMSEVGTFETGQSIMNDAADEIERLRIMVQTRDQQINNFRRANGRPFVET